MKFYFRDTSGNLCSIPLREGVTQEQALKALGNQETLAQSMLVAGKQAKKPVLLVI